jgi:hypothetical protein
VGGACGRCEREEGREEEEEEHCRRWVWTPRAGVWHLLLRGGRRRGEDRRRRRRRRRSGSWRKIACSIRSNTLITTENQFCLNETLPSTRTLNPQITEPHSSTTTVPLDAKFNILPPLTRAPPPLFSSKWQFDSELKSEFDSEFNCARQGLKAAPLQRAAKAMPPKRKRSQPLNPFSALPPHPPPPPLLLLLTGFYNPSESDAKGDNIHWIGAIVELKLDFFLTSVFSALATCRLVFDLQAMSCARLPATRQPAPPSPPLFLRHHLLLLLFLILVQPLCSLCKGRHRAQVSPTEFNFTTKSPSNYSHIITTFYNPKPLFF